MPKYKRNEDGTSTLTTDTGHQVHLIDPDGSFEREMAPPAPDAYAAIAPQQAAPDVPENLGAQHAAATMTPEAVAALNQPSSVGPTANPTVLPDQPQAQPTVAPLGAPGGAGPRATLSDAPAGGNATEVKTNVSDQRSTSTSGMDQASKAKLVAAGAKTDAASENATQLEQKAGAEVAGQREARANQDYMAGFQQQVGALDAEKQYQTAYQAAIDERKAARATKIDPAQAWGSEKNEWAFVAGLGGALAALDAGIGRLQAARGRGYNAEPFDMIDKMVQQSIKQQEDARAQRIASAGESVEAAQAGKLEAASNAHEAAAQVLEAKKLLAASAEEATFLDSAAAKQRVQADLRDEERAKLLANNVTTTNARNTQTATSTGPAGAPRKSKVQADHESALRESLRLRDIFKRAAENGSLKSVVGIQDKLPGFVPGSNGWSEFFGGLPPDQQEALQAIQDYKIHNDSLITRQPKNQHLQEIVYHNGAPKNDSAIPNFLKRLDQQIKIQEDDVNNNPIEEPDQPVEQY